MVLSLLCDLLLILALVVAIFRPRSVVGVVPEQVRGVSWGVSPLQELTSSLDAVLEDCALSRGLGLFVDNELLSLLRQVQRDWNLRIDPTLQNVGSPLGHPFVAALEAPSCFLVHFWSVFGPFSVIFRPQFGQVFVSFGPFFFSFEQFSISFSSDFENCLVTFLVVFRRIFVIF